MINTPDGEEVVSDEDALAFMFAAYAAKGTEGMFVIPQSHRHRLIEKALKQIVTQFEAELGIPWVRGKFIGLGSTIVYLDKPDFSEHVKLYDPNSFGVLDVQVEKSREDGRMVYTGFGAYVRLDMSNTWFSVGIKSPTSEENRSLLDFQDYSEDDEIEEDDDEDSDAAEEMTQEEKERVAFMVATATGFRELKNRQQRMAFVKPILDKESEGKSWYNVFYRPEYELAEMATELYGLGIVPTRAKQLAAEGKTTTEIGKALGISKQKAERAIDAEIPQYIASQIEKFKNE